MSARWGWAVSAETLAIALGRSLTTQAVRCWLSPRKARQDADWQMEDLIRRRIPGLRAQRGLQRQFEQIADTVAGRLEPLCAHEFRGLDAAGRTAAVEAVTDAFARSDLSDAALLEADLDASKLTRRLRASAPAPAGFEEAAREFYVVLLTECCECYVHIVRRLPVFTERGVAELLGRVGTLGEEVSRVLERLPARSLYAPRGEGQDAAFLREYLQLISEVLDEVELVGVSGGPVPRTKLSVAYVSLRVHADQSPGAPGRLRGPPVRAGLGAWETSVAESPSMRVEEALGAGRRLLVRGEAGSGKTTLLQWLAVNAARGTFAGDLSSWNGLVPVLVKLRRHAGREPPALEELLDDTAGPLTGHMPLAFMDRQFTAGRMLLLIDGVDEIQPGDRRKVRAWLRLLLRAYPATRTLVTSRPTAARGDWLLAEDFTSVSLERMSPADTEAFVRQWHQAVRVHGDALPCPPEALPHYERSLLTGLRDRPHLQGLSSNPLLAAMLCALHLERRRQLPRSRMELYRAALELLTQRRDVDRHIPSALTFSPALSLTDKLCLLRDLAWRLSDNNRSEVSAERAREHIAATLASMRHLGADIDAGDVLEHLLSRSGVLREPAEGRIDFVHRSFQEYLAAAGAAAEDRIGNLVGRAHLDTWRETIIMAAGHAHRSQRLELLHGILDRAEEEHQHARPLKMLAASCLEAMDSVPDALSARLDRAIESLLPPRRQADAPALAAIGTPLLSRLPRSLDGLTTNAAETMVRTVALIGGEGALELLREYGNDRRSRVRHQLGEAWEYFDPDEYAERVLSPMIRSGETHLILRHPSQWNAATRLTEARDVRIYYPFADLELIAELPELETLWITDLGEACSLEPLRNRPELRDVVLLGEGDLRDVAALAALSRLESLQIRRWSSLPPLEWIPVPSTLEFLGLGTLSLPTNLEILRTQPHLHTLLLIGDNHGQDLAVLTGLEELRILVLYGFDLDRQDALGAPPRVAQVWLRDCVLPQDLSILGLPHSVTGLELEECRTRENAPLDLTPLAQRPPYPRLHVRLRETSVTPESRHLRPRLRVGRL